MGVAVFLLLFGLFLMLAPEAAWYLSIGWKLRDAEPSDAYLIMNRLGGGIATVIAIILFITTVVHYHSAASEKNFIKNTPIESVVIQMHPVTVNDKASFKNMILNPDWIKAHINNTGGVYAYGASSQIEIHFNNKQVITIDHLMSGKFRLEDQSSHYYEFSSTDLEDWISSQGR